MVISTKRKICRERGNKTGSLVGRRLLLAPGQLNTQWRAIEGFLAQKGHNKSYAFRKIKLPLVTIVAWKEKILKVERPVQRCE